MSLILDKCVCSDLYKIKDILDEILFKINHEINNEDLLFDIKLILNELMANSVLHGNCGDKNKNINLHLELKDNKIKIEITDEGSGFYYDDKKYDPLDLKCSGRGLVLIDGLSDEFYINKNKAVVVKYI